MPVTKESFEALIKDFHDRHKEIYGYSDEAVLTHITALKLTAIGKRRTVHMAEQPVSGEDPSEALKGKRFAYFKEAGGLLETSCYDGDKLRHGNTIPGPAIIEEKMTTIVIPAEAKVRVDSYGNYVARL
jgi:N-methylhydantoinase A